MKNLEKLTNIIESILFVSGEQVAIIDIAEKLEVTEKDVLSAIKALQQKYSAESGINILLFNKKAQFCSNPVYSNEVSSVLNPIKERELSRSLLEVAAIIAYKQPVTRIDLEEIRGSSSEYAVQKLLELNMIEPVGRKDAVGKPVLFGTTDEFLKRFQISSLDELPDYDELINKITMLRSDEVEQEYLYYKDEYVEAEKPESLTAVTTSDEAKNNLSETNIESVNSLNSTNPTTNNNAKEEDEFELPNIDEEEIPDFLKGEEVEKIK